MGRAAAGGHETVCLPLNALTGIFASNSTIQNTHNNI
jgi:hypothetical protein